MKKLVFIILFFLSFNMFAQMTSNKKHRHGHANLNIVVNNLNIEIKATIPGESFVGSEKIVEGKKYKRTLLNAKHTWNNEWKKIFFIRPDLMCKKKKSESIREKIDREHDQYNLSLILVCVKELKEQQMQINLLKFFKNIEYLETKVTKANGTLYRAIIRSNDFKLNL